MKLTLNSLLTAMAEVSAMTPKPMARCLTCRAEVREALRAEFPDTRPTSFGDSLMGIRLYEKPGQIASAWVFSDDATSQKYLAGELTELDLVSMISDRIQPIT